MAGTHIFVHFISAINQIVLPMYPLGSKSHTLLSPIPHQLCTSPSYIWRMLYSPFFTSLFIEGVHLYPERLWHLSFPTVNLSWLSPHYFCQALAWDLLSLLLSHFFLIQNADDHLPCSSFYESFRWVPLLLLQYLDMNCGHGSASEVQISSLSVTYLGIFIYKNI